MILPKPNPDFDTLVNILSGRIRPDKVRFVEGVDKEVISVIMKTLFGQEFPFIDAEKAKHQEIQTAHKGKRVKVSVTEAEQAYLTGFTDFSYRMGLDYVLDDWPNNYLLSLLQPRIRIAEDTAEVQKCGDFLGMNISGGLRGWAEETSGIISSRHDFENFPWDSIELDICTHYDFLEKIIPSGMKAMLCFNFYGFIQDQFLGYQGLSYMLYDDLKLVKELAETWGQIIYRYYQQGIERDFVGGIFHGDDFGHKTGTSLNPEILRTVFLPWLAKYSELAHSKGKVFWLHSCGNLKDIMEDLITDVRIDAFHSFQDIIIPVTDFKRKYQDRIAVLGGVDMDKLIRLEEQSLRTYIRSILEQCMPDGRYALGSGNSISNYVPVKNYLLMIEEGQRWKCKNTY